MTEQTEITVTTEDWFDDLVSTLRSDQLALEADVASPLKKDLYEKLMHGSADTLAHANLTTGRNYFISQMLFEYVKLVGNSGINLPTKLAFSFHNSELLVWAEIPTGREDIEEKLILAEAKVNAKFHQLGFDIITTFVEDCDKLAIPSHYRVLA